LSCWTGTRTYSRERAGLGPRRMGFVVVVVVVSVVVFLVALALVLKRSVLVFGRGLGALVAARRDRPGSRRGGRASGRPFIWTLQPTQPHGPRKLARIQTSTLHAISSAPVPGKCLSALARSKSSGLMTDRPARASPSAVPVPTVSRPSSGSSSCSQTAQTHTYQFHRSSPWLFTGQFLQRQLVYPKSGLTLPFGAPTTRSHPTIVFGPPASTSNPDTILQSPTRPAEPAEPDHRSNKSCAMIQILNLNE
jgi:hypothetical protein